MEEDASDIDYIFDQNHLAEMFSNQLTPNVQKIQPFNSKDTFIIEEVILPKAKLISASIIDSHYSARCNPQVKLDPTISGSEITQRQQKLVLLFHSSQCNSGPFCSITHHCWEMKQLFIHIKDCKRRICPMAHCASSKLALHHYTRCEDSICFICIPIRNIVYQSLGENSTWPRSS